MTHKDFWKEYPKPIIGLAPMEGYSDSAMRRVCKAVNPNIITYTEFTSADGLHYNNTVFKKKMSFDPSEQPIIAQIFGKNIDTFVRAAKMIEDAGFTGLDLNMGCPAKKVVKSEHGMALRKNHCLAFELVEAVANATKLPISVKTRLGWSGPDDLITFCKGAENAGANMIAIHARTYVQPYKVAAQWEPLYELKKHLSIPLIGNGGIESIADGLEKCRVLDGFLIGQAAIGNPWVFDSGEKPCMFAEKVPLIINHAKWLIEQKGEVVGTREIRKHLLSYVKSLPGAKSFRQKLVHVQSLSDVENSLAEIVALL